MGFSDFYTPPSASWATYNQWLAEQEAAKQQQQSGAGNSYGGLGGAIGTLGGMYAAKKLMDAKTYTGLAEALGYGNAAELGATQIPSLGAMNTAGSLAASNATAALAPSDAALASWGLGEGGAEVAAGAGSNAGSMGSSLAAASPYLGAAGLGLGAYGIYNATQMADKKKAALAGGLSGAGMGMGGAMLALGAANMWNPVGWALIGGGALGGAGLSAALAHKSTKQYQAERQQALRDKGITGYAAFMDQIDPSKDPNYGKVPDFDNLRAEDVWGSEGAFSTFGNDWLGKYTEDQRRQISQALLDQKLFQGDHGDVIIHSKNQDRAREIASGILGGGVPAGTAPIPSSSPVAQAVGEALGDLGAGTRPLESGSLWDQTTPWLQAEREAFANGAGGSGAWAVGAPGGSSVAGALAGALQAAKPDYAKLVAEGKYRKGSEAAGGYVNNETNEWVAG